MTQFIEQARVDRRRFLLGGIGLAVSASALAACGSDSGAGGASTAAATGPAVKPKADGDITWFTWSEYVDPRIVAAFEKEYGVKVKQTFFDSDEAMVQKVATGLPYDLITTNSAYIDRMVQGELLRPFDLADLRNSGEIDDYFTAPVYDRGEPRYTVPYGYGPAGIAYRTNRVSGMNGSWDDFWDQPDASGHIILLDQIEETLGISLIRNGADPNTADPALVQAAADRLAELKPRLSKFSSDTINDLVDEGTWMQHTWSGTAYQGILQAKDPENISFELPREGVMIGVDTLSIGTNAKSPGTAMLFMDWILRPEHAAKNTVWQGQMVGTKASKPAYDELTKDFPFLQFGDDILTHGAWKHSLTGERQQVWNQQWTRLKAA